MLLGAGGLSSMPSAPPHFPGLGRWARAALGMSCTRPRVDLSDGWELGLGGLVLGSLVAWLGSRRLPARLLPVWGFWVSLRIPRHGGESVGRCVRRRNIPLCPRVLFLASVVVNMQPVGTSFDVH